MTTTNQPKTFLERDEWLRSILASDLPRAARCLAFAIALHLNVKTGRCDPGHKALSEDTGISERSVRRFVALLERDGWLATKRRGHGNTNSYVLLRPASILAGQRPASDVADQENYDRPVSAHMTGQFGSHDRPVGGRQKEKNSEKRKEGRKGQTLAPDVASLDFGDDAPTSPDRNLRRNPTEVPSHDNVMRRNKTEPSASAFPEFWSAYPKRVAKAEAAKAFAAAIKRGADPVALIDGAKRYANERAGQDPRYSKHPSTWLNADCWLDESFSHHEKTIDQQGNVIETPVPRRSGPQSEIVRASEELLAKIRAGRR